MEDMQALRRGLEAFRRRAILTALLLVALGAFLIYQARAVAARRDAGIVAALTQQLADDAAAANWPAPEAFIAKTPAQITYAPYRWLEQTPVAIWKYSDGVVSAATPDELAEARRLGTAFMVAYSLDRYAPGALWVDVALNNPAAAGAGLSTGGYASHWQLRWAAGAWQITTRTNYLYWK